MDVILNKSYHKLGFQNGKGKTYEALLTTSSIPLAQKYYELLTRVKNGETPLKIDEKIKQVLPDFPKFAITYSVSENEEGSQVNQQKMQFSLDEYNKMFGTKYEISQIQGYNGNLNKRLARKEPRFKSRNEQLDLVIVVDRLLTGFDAPCLSTIFIDRQPMGPHDLIQAFSRTNRIYDKNKIYGQIVTFQAPILFKKCVDNAVKLYSAGGTKEALLAEWDEIELDENKYKGKSILNIVENMKQDCINKVITDFCITWYASKDDIMYAAAHYRDGVIPNESAIKATIDYKSYKAAQERALPKFKYFAQMMAELRKTLDEEIRPLIDC